MLFSLQALESRGISELLLTSDSHEGLKSGGVNGGEALRCENSPKSQNHTLYFLQCFNWG